MKSSSSPPIAPAPAPVQIPTMAAPKDLPNPTALPASPNYNNNIPDQANLPTTPGIAPQAQFNEARPDFPTYLDPTAIANQQFGMNRNTAASTYGFNASNQSNPYGSLAYKQVGTWPDGTPRYEANVSLSPEEMSKQQAAWNIQGVQNQTALDQAKRAQEFLAQPYDISNASTESRLMELGRQRLDPILAQKRAAKENQLANQGFVPGTEAYDRAMAEVGRNESDAYNQLLLTGRQQAVNEQQAARNQALGEFKNFGTPAAVQGPSFINTPNVNVANTDVSGLTTQAYQLGPLAQYNSNVDLRQNDWQNQRQLWSDLLGANQQAYANTYAGAQQDYTNRANAAQQNWQNLYNLWQGNVGTAQQDWQNQYNTAQQNWQNLFNTQQANANIINQNNQGAMNAWQANAALQQQQNAQQQQQKNAMMSGLFGLGGAAIGGALGGPIGSSLGMTAGNFVGGLSGSPAQSGYNTTGGVYYG